MITRRVSGGTATSAIDDARGRAVALRQYHGPAPTPSVPGSYDATSYVYDHAGRLSSVTDQAGIGWSWGYDQRGRRTSSADPDKSTTLSTYDDAGQLTSSTDARGVTLSYVYDELGRRTQLWQGQPGAGTKRAEWVVRHDPARHSRPLSTRFEASNAYVTAVTGYDAGYRPTGTSVTIPAAETGLAGTYTFGTTYTANGKVSTQSLPATAGLPAETLTTTYHPNGAPRKLTGTNQYVTNSTYWQTGELTSMTHNSVTAYRGFDHDPVTKRLMHINVQSGGTPNILKETQYSYDDAGNVTKISDLLEQYGPGFGSDDTQCFDYDYLRRLAPGLDAGLQRLRRGAVGGRVGWGGAVLAVVDLRQHRQPHQPDHPPGRRGPAGSRTPPPPGQPRPHSVSATTAARRSARYGYDETGNTISRPGPSAQQTLTWDPEGHLATLTEGPSSSSYLYDAAGNRLITRDPTGATLHLPLGVEVHVNPGGGGASSPAATATPASSWPRGPRPAGYRGCSRTTRTPPRSPCGTPT